MGNWGSPIRDKRSEKGEKERRSFRPPQTVDKVPGIRRGFSFLVIHFSYIFSVFIKKNVLLINAKVKRYSPSTWYNYLIRRFRL